MLQLTPQSTIFVATIHIDFRKGIDGLIAVCNQKLTINPLWVGLYFYFIIKAKPLLKSYRSMVKDSGSVPKDFLKVNLNIKYNL